MNTDSPEFTAILERVPRWHMLTPGKDRWVSGDQYFYHSLPFTDSDENWGDVGAYHIESISVVMFDCLGRRPIPEPVRRSMAWWALYNQLATVAPYSGAVRFTILYVHSGRVIETAFNYAGLRGLAEDENLLQSVALLTAVRDKMQFIEEGPGAYMRWVLSE